jgi:hypothetical protein
LAFINMKKREIQAKVVYYGPGRGGKTSNLEYIYRLYRERIPSDMVSIKTHGDRTLFFDFLPFDVGKIQGYTVRFLLYTVPGQVKYDATRKLVLKGVDGIVFVADSLRVQRQRNVESLRNLEVNLEAYRKDIYRIPLVIQYNKRDLTGREIPILSIEDLEQDLNARLHAPAFPASAVTGENVITTLKKIISLTMASLQKIP